jgi:aldehyde dehydrogenase (NAD+)
LTGLSTEAKIATVHAASEDDVDKAVKAARAALVHESWKHLPGTDRGILMAKLADLLEQNKELFATVDAWDNGS